jgi:carbamoyltransferase
VPRGPVYILGISGLYHDAAAALLCDGEIVAAAQQERFSRRKGDPSFPLDAARYCLREGGIDATRLEAVALHEKPWLHLERVLESALATAPRGLGAFALGMPRFLGEKLGLAQQLRRELGWRGAPLYVAHHESHMAAAFYPSPFQRAAILTVDGVGEWATCTWGWGDGAELKVGAEVCFPHSIGLLYSSVTAYLGFQVNSGEYKVMGLAPYGEPRYVQPLLEDVVDLRPDGSFRLNLDFFDYPSGLAMTSARFHQRFGGPPRAPEHALEQRHRDLARSVQAVTEEVLLRMARHAHHETGMDALVLGGGVALNAVANGRLAREGPFSRVWVQPAPGDAGSALGCALAAWHRYLGEPRRADGARDQMRGAYLGPKFEVEEARRALDELGARYREIEREAVAGWVADRLADGRVVALFQGRMEFGPRALGARSILADPRPASMRDRLNERIKRREPFRPFAPAILSERARDYFELSSESPYMLFVHPAKTDALEAVTHVDGSARVQTVDGAHNARFRQVIEAFEARTGCPAVLNTSFNLRDEPIVCTPEDAARCFAAGGIDALAVENLVLELADQPAFAPRPPLDRWAIPRRLRRFALGLGAASGFAGLWGAWRPGAVLDARRLALLGLTLGLLGLMALAPRALRGPERAFSAVARGLGDLAARMVLAAFFVAGVTPLGLLRRLFGSDVMGARRAPDEGSYWRAPAPDPRGRERYRQRF